jgi:hypothetical protein
VAQEGKSVVFPLRSPLAAAGTSMCLGGFEQIIFMLLRRAGTIDN